MKIHNLTRNISLSENVVLADTFFSRLAGLIPKNKLTGDEGLLLTRCAMIHSCFMRFPIDAVFISKEGKVAGVLENFRPWRFSKHYPGAFYTAEFRAGFVSGKVSPGDSLEIKH